MAFIRRKFPPISGLVLEKPTGTLSTNAAMSAPGVMHQHAGRADAVDVLAVDFQVINPARAGQAFYLGHRDRAASACKQLARAKLFQGDPAPARLVPDRMVARAGDA